MSDRRTIVIPSDPTDRAAIRAAVGRLVSASPEVALLIAEGVLRSVSVHTATAVSVGAMLRETASNVNRLRSALWSYDGPRVAR